MERPAAPSFSWGGCVMARSVSAISLSSIVVLFLLAPAQGRSLIETSAVMPISEASPTLSPFQHVRFCLRYPADCKSDPTETTAVELTAETLETIHRVNRDVNASIMPVGRSNAIADGGWTISPASGDCNDYAVTKRHDLVRSGFPTKAVRLAVVKTTSGIGHLVLVVSTNKGDLVLDNLSETILPWQFTKYQWVKIQSASDARYWFEIKPRGFVLSQVDRKIGSADR
jgi:predicted transglutaminase-like cysteine proteinase